MALIPDEPKQQRAFIVIVLTLGLFYLFWDFVYGPEQEELTASQERLEELEQSNRRARVLATRGGADLEERMALYERHILKLEELIPAREEVPRLIRQITATAGAMDVDVDFLEPQPDESGEFYTRDPYTMRVLGQYHNVARFLTSIASLSRIITPVDVEMVELPDAAAELTGHEDGVQATFDIVTYVVPEDRGVPPATVGGEEGP